MLDAAWIIPLIPALSFVLILFFGKKMPRQGSEIGIAALATSFVLSCVAVVQWINRVDAAEGGHGASARSARASCSPARGARRGRAADRAQRHLVAERSR